MSDSLHIHNEEGYEAESDAANERVKILSEQYERHFKEAGERATDAEQRAERAETAERGWILQRTKDMATISTLTERVEDWKEEYQYEKRRAEKLREALVELRIRAQMAQGRDGSIGAETERDMLLDIMGHLVAYTDAALAADSTP